MKLRIKELSSGCIPQRAHAEDAGADLVSKEDVVIPAGGRALVGTGVAIETPEGMVSLVCSRSGLAAKHGVHVLNGPGVVDPGYIGEVFVNLHNAGRDDFHIQAGDRVAQLLLVPVVYPEFEVSDSLGSSDRGESGHGSTGL
jgi:dUTP diphosphatase